MSKSFETSKAELQALYSQLTNEEKKLLEEKKQELINARGEVVKSNTLRKD